MINYHSNNGEQRMKYRTLGRTGIEVSVASLGSGGPSKLGQNRNSTQSYQNRLLKKSLDLGINFFDTSPIYGESESIIGTALNDTPRDKYVVCTKWSYERKSTRLKDDLVNSINRSLKKLKTDHIDVLLIHGLTPNSYELIYDEIYPQMMILKEVGKIRFIGFSESFESDSTHKAASIGLEQNPLEWDVIMLKYGILNQTASKIILPLAQEHNVGIINMAAVRIKLPSPLLLESLILDWVNRGLVARDSLDQKKPLDWLITADTDSVIAAGYKFAIDHDAISTVLIGTGDIGHLEDNVKSIIGNSLPNDHKVRLVDLFGHISDYA